MKTFPYSAILQIGIILLTSSGVKKSFGQDKLDWHINLGAGITSMRNFNNGFHDLQYQMTETNGSIHYEINEKPDMLLNGGIGISGTFRNNTILAWETGLNIRTAGFRITPSVLDSNGELTPFIRDLLPKFGETKSFRYWALHIPISLNYMPFELVGFHVGGDLYYQLSSNPTDEQFPYGKLGQAMGFSSLNTPDYQHPFQFGGHIGIFAPIGEKVRLDLQLIADINPRLTVKQVSETLKFREIGIVVNAKYKLKW